MSTELSAQDFSSYYRDIMTDDYIDFNSNHSAVSEKVTKLYDWPKKEPIMVAMTQPDVSKLLNRLSSGCAAGCDGIILL